MGLGWVLGREGLRDAPNAEAAGVLPPPGLLYRPVRAAHEGYINCCISELSRAPLVCHAG